MKKLIDWFKNIEIVMTKRQARYILGGFILLFSIGIIWWGLSSKESEVSKLNKLTEKMTAIENKRMQAINKVYPYYTDAEKLEKLSQVIKDDNEYRTLNFQFKEIEQKQNSPSEVCGYGLLIGMVSLIFASLGVYIYTETDFSEEPKYLISILAIIFIPMVFSFTLILTTLLK